MSTFPRMVHGYIEEQLNKVWAHRESTLGNLISPPAVQNYVDKCRETIRSLYPLPQQGRDTSAEILGTIEHKKYRIEKLVFESRPGLRVTSNLYIPKGSGPHPCILFACGHTDLGKAEGRYQRFCAGAASLGFLVLAYDPIGQGERKQFPDIEALKGCVAEHVVLGTKMSLIGDYFGAWRAYDGIRALDILLARPEADTTRVGMTGNSGGGTMTTIITALDDRLTMAAPSCYINTYRRNFENELPADTEQTPPGILNAGYELFDHLTAAAPRPTLICSKEDDFFDQRGTIEAYQNLKDTYAQLGKGEDIQMFTGPGGHGFDIELREAVYKFFSHYAGMDTNTAETEIEVHTTKELSCFAKPMESRKVADLVRESFHNRVNDRIGFSQEKLHHLLGSPDLPHDPPAYRILRRRDDRSRIAVETESGIFTVMSYQAPENYQFRPPVSEKAILYVPHLDEYPESKNTVLTVSTRGSGESRYDTCGAGDYFGLYDSDYFYSSHCWMLGFPLAGRKVYDLLRVVQLLRAGGCKEFELRGRGCGALIALYAAPFIPDLSKLYLSNCLPSLADIVEADMSRWPQSVLVPGILNYMDLPDIIDEVENRCVVEITEPGKPLSA